MRQGKIRVKTFGTKMFSVRGPHTMSYNENKTHKEIIFLPFCCFHVRGHQKPTLENENNLFTFSKGQH